MSFLRTIARPILAYGFIGEGIERVRNAEEAAPEIGKALEPVTSILPVSVDDYTITRVLGVSEIAAGALISIGKFTKLSGVVLAKVSIINAIIDWNKLNNAPVTPAAENSRRLALMKNLSQLGGALYALTDSKGKPSHKWLAEARRRERARSK